MSYFCSKILLGNEINSKFYLRSLCRVKFLNLYSGVTHDSTQPDSMIGQFRYILRNEGFFGLYRGITPNFMKVEIQIAILVHYFDKWNFVRLEETALSSA